MKRLLLSLLLVPLSAATVLGRDEADPEPPLRKVICAIRTNQGTIKVELFEKEAPVTVKNFLGYVGDRFYDGVVFHRVIENFMVQGGGFKKGFAGAAGNLNQFEKKAKAPIKNESANGLSNKRGTLAVARAAAADSGTSQFFINVKDNDFLNRTESRVGYAVFGKVIAGMDVVDKIAKVKTKSVGIHNDVPAEDVVIESVRRVPR